MEMKRVEGGVCAARGFVANGLNCGLNPDKEKHDLALIYSETPCQAAAVYTTNKVKGAPILVTKSNLTKSGNIARAVIANSKNANTGNADGEEKAYRMCELAAQELGIQPEEVIVASTGVIGLPLPIEPIENSIHALAQGLSAEHHGDAAYAIMTTDTVRKEVAVQYEVGGCVCTVGGMAKGSGMIHPNMATMLVFVTTYCAISPAILQKALGEDVKASLLFLRFFCFFVIRVYHDILDFVIGNKARGVEKNCQCNQEGKCDPERGEKGEDNKIEIKNDQHSEKRKEISSKAEDGENQRILEQLEKR